MFVIQLCNSLLFDFNSQKCKLSLLFFSVEKANKKMLMRNASWKFNHFRVRKTMCAGSSDTIRVETYVTGTWREFENPRNASRGPVDLLEFPVILRSHLIFFLLVHFCVFVCICAFSSRQTVMNSEHIKGKRKRV